MQFFRYWHHLLKGAETSDGFFKSGVAWLLFFLPTIFVPLALALRLLAGTVLHNLPGGSLPGSLAASVPVVASNLAWGPSRVALRSHGFAPA